LGIDQEEQIIMGVVVEHLNKRTGSFFRYKSSVTSRPILARMHEGFALQDLLDVIDTMSGKWLGNETMERYLRPQTLFGSKFESYLQEARRNKKAPSEAETIGGFRSAKELMEDG
jgi:uncharacterized phage protein (TIGR02220 family)